MIGLTKPSQSRLPSLIPDCALTFLSILIGGLAGAQIRESVLGVLGVLRGSVELYGFGSLRRDKEGSRIFDLCDTLLQARVRGGGTRPRAIGVSHISRRRRFQFQRDLIRLSLCFDVGGCGACVRVMSKKPPSPPVARMCVERRCPARGNKPSKRPRCGIYSHRIPLPASLCLPVFSPICRVKGTFVRTFGGMGGARRRRI